MHHRFKYRYASADGFLCGLFLICLFNVAWVATAHAVIGPFPGVVRGSIGTKGLVLGPENAPIWVEYNKKGDVIREIGEASKYPLKRAWVTSALNCRIWIDAFESARKNRQSCTTVMSVGDYYAAAPVDSLGRPIPKPYLTNETRTVLVVSEDCYTGAGSWVVHESPLDFTMGSLHIPETHTTALISIDGNIITTAEVNIGFRSAFYVKKDGSTGSGDSSVSGFIPGSDTLCGPMQGVKVTVAGADGSGISIDNGTYAFTYGANRPGCPGYTFSYEHNVQAMVRYQKFNPRSKNPYGIYYVWRPLFDFCSGFGDAYFPATIHGQSAKMALTSTDMSNTSSFHMNHHITVDVAMLSGEAQLYNPGKRINLGAKTVYDGNEAEEGNPFSDLCLLSEISENDLKDTDVYIFRESTGQAITFREGLTTDEVGKDERAELAYRLFFRGPSDFVYKDRGGFSAWQDKYNFNPDLVGLESDQLRPGEPIRVILINRATGYMGSGIASLGSVNGTEGDLISFSPGKIAMMPPNLKIRAERLPGPPKGSGVDVTAGAGIGVTDRQTGLISFQGAGASDDTYISISTEWVDASGNPLPPDLPGFTGRIAEVVSENTISSAGSISHFDIIPGRHQQIIQLPREKVDNVHYYLHVSPQPLDRNPDFSSDIFAEGPLMYRPARYVPVLVPIFNPDATRMNAIFQIEALKAAWNPGDPMPVVENIIPRYEWVYRPEFQFSVYDITVDPLSLETSLNPETGQQTTQLDASYHIGVADDPLPSIGSDGALLIKAGFEIALALVEEKVSDSFNLLGPLQGLPVQEQASVIEHMVNALTPQDMLSLQIYAENDLAIPLYEYTGLPLVVASIQPAKIQRTQSIAKFNDNISAPPENIDSYGVFRFTLNSPASVTVTVLDADDEVLGKLVNHTSLNSGTFLFHAAYKTLTDMGMSPDQKPTATLKLEAVSDNGTITQTVLYPVVIEKRTQGRMLGQIMAHDVLIQDGSLNLSRQDFSVSGRGPDLDFSRSYSNLSPGPGHKPLGPGWRHNLDFRLTPMRSGDMSAGGLPKWVQDLNGKFYKPEQVPEDDGELRMVAVNGTTFYRPEKTSTHWEAERGRHGTLDEADGKFVFTAKSGTQYFYIKPKRGLEADTAQITSQYMHIGDSILSRLGIYITSLKLDETVVVGKEQAAPASPSHVAYIKDRNDNRLSYVYDELNRIETITDSVGRTLTLSYKAHKADPFKGRLSNAQGPGGILVEFTYDEDGFLTEAKRGDRKETYGYAWENRPFAPSKNLTSATDSNNHTTSYDYYKEGDIPLNVSHFVKGLQAWDVIKTVTYPADGPEPPYATFKYDVDSGNKREVIGLNKRPTHYTLNMFGNPRIIEEPENKTTRMTWSIDEGKSDNVMTSRTDGREFTTYYKYDSKGNITQEINPLGGTIDTTWNLKYSLPVSRTDENRISQSWTYDPKGNLTEHTDGDQKKTTYTVYATGEVHTMIDPRGGTTTYTYDDFGLPDTSTSPEGAVVDTDYDERGRLLKQTTPPANLDTAPVITEFLYNDLDQKTRVNYPSVEINTELSPSAHFFTKSGSDAKYPYEEFEYDAEGNLKKHTDRMGLTLTYKYTARDQVAEIVRSTKGTKIFRYDVSGNLELETDWKGDTSIATRYEYDDLNRRTKTINRVGAFSDTGYDATDNVVSQSDFNGHTTVFEYDDLGRLEKKILPQNPDGSPGGEINYTYYNGRDPKTNLKTETDASPRQYLTTYIYNGRYQIIEKQMPENVTWKYGYDDSGNLETEEIIGENNLVKYDYDGDNRRTLTTYPANSDGEIPVVKTDYSPSGNIVAVTDPRGKTTDTVYDDFNRPVKVTYPKEIFESFVYDPAGNIVQTIDKRQNPRTVLRNAMGQARVETDAEGFIRYIDYTVNGNIEKIETNNEKGLIVVNSYDAEGRLKKVLEKGKDGLAREKEIIARDGNGNILSETDFKKNITTYEYNARNQVILLDDPDPEHPSAVTITRYDENGRLVKITNKRGFDTSYEFDGLGREVLLTDSYTQTVVKTYDKSGNVKTIWDKRKKAITSHDYDKQNRLLETRRGEGDTAIRVVKNTYDIAGNLTAQTDARELTTRFYYNDLNQVEKTEFPDGGYSETKYDENGNILKASIPVKSVAPGSLKWTVYTYDYENRPLTVTFAGETTRTEYDIEGRKDLVIRPKGNTTDYEYDSFSRLETVIQGSLKTSYTYDANNNLTSQSLPGGPTTEFKYDALNRRTAMIEGGIRTTRFNAFDANGNLKQKTDPNGNITGYDYDRLDRKIEERFSGPSQSPFLNLSKITYGYDENNNLTSVTESKTGITDRVVNIFDAFDRLTSTTRNGSAVSYTYDDNGNRKSVTTPAGVTVYTYDEKNRVKTAASEVKQTSWDYHSDGRIEKITYPNGTTTVYGYKESLRVEYIAHISDGASEPFAGFGYEYDDNGNRTRQYELQSGATEVTDYTYDGNDRMTGYSIQDEAGHIVESAVYTFEYLNRKTEEKYAGLTHIASRTYAYDGLNQLTSVTDDADPANPKTIDYVYDSAGNTISRTDVSTPTENIRFSYDTRNRLVKTVRGPPENEILSGLYDYDYRGLRVRVRNGDRGDVDYLYDGSSIVEERKTDGSLIARYIYADRAMRLDTPTGRQYYHHDALGTTSNLTGDDGAVLVSYRTDPWGTIRSQTGESVNRQIFTGQEHDESTGLIYFGARYYDPVIGRFITQDRYLGEPGTPPSLHRYLYAYSNPTVYIDLSGYYARDVHGYFIFFAAMSQGADVNTARAIAAYSQGPDARKDMDAVEAAKRMAFSPEGSEVYESAKDIQSRYHGLGAGSVKEFRQDTEDRLGESIKSGKIDTFGYDLHAYADSYAHAQIDYVKIGSLYGSSSNHMVELKTGTEMYPSFIGHFFDSTLPDKVSKRKKDFLAFAGGSRKYIGSYLGETNSRTYGAMGEDMFNNYAKAIADVDDDSREAFIIYMMGGDPQKLQYSRKSSQLRSLIIEDTVNNLDLETFDALLAEHGLERLDYLTGQTITVESLTGKDDFIPAGCEFQNGDELNQWVEKNTGIKAPKS